MLWKSSCLITENPTKNILKPENGTELPTTKDNAPDKGGENDNDGILFTNNWLKAKAIEDRGTDFRKPAVRQCIEEILQPKDGTELPRTQDNTPDERGKIRPVARIFHGGGGGGGGECLPKEPGRKCRRLLGGPGARSLGKVLKFEILKLLEKLSILPSPCYFFYHLKSFTIPSGEPFWLLRAAYGAEILTTVDCLPELA